MAFISEVMVSISQYELLCTHIYHCTQTLAFTHILLIPVIYMLLHEQKKSSLLNYFILKQAAALMFIMKKMYT